MWTALGVTAVVLMGFCTLVNVVSCVLQDKRQDRVIAFLSAVLTGEAALAVTHFMAVAP